VETGEWPGVGEKGLEAEKQEEFDVNPLFRGYSENEPVRKNNVHTVLRGYSA
jgi:hypothetical protein